MEGGGGKVREEYMESPKILFNNKKVKVNNDSLLPQNVRTSVEKHVTSPKKRQTRSDKKHDIKINLTMEQRQMLKRLTKNIWDRTVNKDEITQTYVCTQLLKKALLMKKTDFPEVKYPKSDSKKGRAKLEEKYYNLLFEYTVKWDCSYAKAAHRIFLYALEMEVKQ